MATEKFINQIELEAPPTAAKHLARLGDVEAKIAEIPIGNMFDKTSAADLATLSGLGMPSGRLVNFTLPATGGVYTAPANGWIVVTKVATAVAQYFSASANSIYSIVYAPTASSSVSVVMPILKGVGCTFSYTVAGNTQIARFVYAEGN